MMEIGGLVAAVGLVLTVISFTYAFADAAPGWLGWYDGIVDQPQGNWNTVVIIVGPILLIMGGFYLGEQIVLRRRFERLIDTTKKSEFTSRRRDLDDLSKRLPTNFSERLRDKEAEFRGGAGRRA